MSTTHPLLSNKPLLVTLIVLVVYAAWFILPVFFADTSNVSASKAIGVKGAISQFATEAIIAIALFITISSLRWWRKIGFQAINSGGMKFLLPPIFLIILLTVIVAIVKPDSPGFLGFSNLQEFMLISLVILLLGFNEELIFRGITFFGFRSIFSPLTAIIITALIFGLFHYVNLLAGQGFSETSYQVIHATAAGFMYGALLLRIGAIWPVMIFHGVWDLSIFNIQTMLGVIKANIASVTPVSTVDFSLIHALLMMLPAMLYGSFVYWRWSLLEKR